MPVLNVLGRQALRVAAVRRAALTVAAARGHRLVLVFHRISDGNTYSAGLIPSVPASLFRRQLELLLDAGDIVPLEALLDSTRDQHRPRFALTFDDDSITHYETALPVLREFGVTATFFLSGRSLHGLGPLWFEKLDHLIATRGIRAATRWLGIDEDDPERLAVDCENDLLMQQRMDELPDVSVRHLSGAQIRALVEAGMAIGFHTLEHRLLSLLSGSAVDEALERGKPELEQAAGHPMRLFAYPHGKADCRIPERLQAAGFVAACTGRPHPMRPGDDPYLIGRWEAGPIGIDRFVTGLAARLNGWSSRA
jgi:peptidoglycan/xylan/chitin deacetylase (PgdA/CDA1 family)